MNAALKDGITVKYWRKGNEEVDFVLQKAEKLAAIEVKSGAGMETKGMDTSRNQYSPAKVYLVAKSGIPWEEFLEVKVGDLL